MGRNVTEGPVPQRHRWKADEGIHRDVERNCRDIACYLLELARRGDVEPALGALKNALDDGMQNLEGEARSRAEHFYRALSMNDSSLGMRRARGDQVDPYFWG